MQQRIFGTDGIRGIANTGYLTPENVTKLGEIIGFLLHKNHGIFITHQLPRVFKLPKSAHKQKKLSVLVGNDSRISGPMLEDAIAGGLTSEGIDVIKIGVISTPALAYLARVEDVALGVMISASHNQYDSNGIKIFSTEGVKIPDKAELLIEKYLSGLKSYKPVNPLDIGHIINDSKKVNDYIKYICNKHSHYLNDVKIVLDCANGGTSYLAPEVFKRLGAKIISIGCAPNGTNINKNCGSLYPERVKRAVLKHKADIGFSFDGDGDRVIITDEKGNIRDGDYVKAILARHYKKLGKLAKNTVVGTVMSNTGLEVSLREAGIKLVRTPVGDRNVADSMFRNGYILGGEQSGHIILLNRSITGDGLITALEILKVMKAERKTFSRLSDCMKKYPQVLVNLKVKSKPELSSLKGYKAKVGEITKSLGVNNQVVIRYSGTEPLLRIMIEAEDMKKIKSAADELVKFFSKHIPIIK